MTSTANRRIIYDIGANAGQDIDYYLCKADRLIAVEADPVLCQAIAAQWSDAIAAGLLMVVNAVMTADTEATEVDFYLHRSDHQLSQYPRPQHDISNFTAVRLPAISPAALIARYGEPYYFKTDIENYDGPLLQALFEAGHRPPFVSAEYHGASVFAAMVAAGRYDAFQIVEAAEVPRRFAGLSIATNDGPARWNFALHSTGPFGSDLPGPWYSADDFLRVLATSDLSWADIHAARSGEVAVTAFPGPGRAAFDYLSRRVVRKFARRLRR